MSTHGQESGGEGAHSDSTFCVAILAKSREEACGKTAAVACCYLRKRHYGMLWKLVTVADRPLSGTLPQQTIPCNQRLRRDLLLTCIKTGANR